MGGVNVETARTSEKEEARKVRLRRTVALSTEYSVVLYRMTDCWFGGEYYF